MPQLMPMLWLSSFLISIFLMLTMIDMYHYKESMKIKYNYTFMYMFKSKLMW